MRGAREESRYDYDVGFVFRNGVVVLAACAAAFGCSLSSGYTSDPSTAETTNDVNKGTSEAGPGGGGGGGGSGGGGGGGGVSDGGAGLEGNPDAGNVAKSTFCMSDGGGALLACDDFDESMMLASNWVKDEQGAGSIVLDSIDAKSAPNSVLATVPAHATNYLYHDVQLKTGAGNGAFAIELDANVTADLNASGSNIANNYACILQVPSDQREYVSLCFGKTESAAYINTFSGAGALTNTKVPLSFVMPQGSWHHFRVAFTFAQSGSLSVEIDGMKVGGVSGVRTADTKATLLYVYPEIGLETDGQWGNTTARFDNVRLMQQ